MARGTDWNVPFDGARGVAAGAVVGYRLHRMVRVEVEYVNENLGLLAELRRALQ
ncbi:MAG: hypothetical protein OXI76_09875 [Gemmatimonadota bacterium]|nr:hypothetical protein [Gemmatimonadota bacterium]